MNHFFTPPENISEEFISILGIDVNHIKNVLRMKVDEEVLVSDGFENDYYCKIYSVDEDEIKLKIINKEKAKTELSSKFVLFQGLPKSDKMELIVQKAVELGVFEIVPVQTKRTIVKLDEKKEKAKINRWQSISESAAKQCQRNVIPKIKPVMTFNQALSYAKELDINIIPYENFKDIKSTRKTIDNINEGMSVGVFIGPEGGFDQEEIKKAFEYDVMPISLGRRILRTETAGLAILSILMFNLEKE